MMKKQVILYILARAVQVITTALASNITALLFINAAYEERGYRAVGGEIIPVVLVAIAVWHGMGWLMKVWYRDMITERRKK